MFRISKDKVTSNSLVFATKEEAEAYAYDKVQVWAAAIDWFVMETDDPVNYAYINGIVMPIDNPMGEYFDDDDDDDDDLSGDWSQ